MHASPQRQRDVGPVRGRRHWEASAASSFRVEARAGREALSALAGSIGYGRIGGHLPQVYPNSYEVSEGG
jgi:hypothetical protein